MKRYHIRLLFQQGRGFTLMELVLTLAIASIVMVPLYSILVSTGSLCMRGEEKDELILNGSYAIEYIKNEIRSAEILVSTDKISGFNDKFPNNLGFLLVLLEGDEYNYVSYHMKNGKIVRIASKVPKERYPYSKEFSGNNEVCRFVEDVSFTYLDRNNKMIHLDFNFKSQGKKPIFYRVRTDLYIRSKTDF